ncbi:MAG: DnaJ domain-containing protein [Deltaproteobacteria bacterium]|nr:DnaJ domain-containing protein [Deltaproteobacteria bacterium]
MLSSRLRRPDYYRILQVDPSADKASINAAFRRLARQYHPDANPSADTTRQFQEINEAHRVLSDDASRSEYDVYRAARAEAAKAAAHQHATAVRTPTHRRHVSRSRKYAAARREQATQQRMRRVLMVATVTATIILLAFGYWSYRTIYPGSRAGRNARAERTAKTAKGMNAANAAARQAKSRLRPRPPIDNCAALKSAPANDRAGRKQPIFDAAGILHCDPQSNLAGSAGLSAPSFSFEPQGRSPMPANGPPQ